MKPLSDRVVVVALVGTVALVFALVFWTVRLAPSPEGPLQWREGAPEALAPSAPGSALLALAAPAAAAR
ncbi:MAG: hypothetical protein ACK55X_13650 [Synechococcaceae cyanobacterium]|jgi:hypothetical protein